MNERRVVQNILRYLECLVRRVISGDVPRIVPKVIQVQLDFIPVLRCLLAVGLECLRSPLCLVQVRQATHTEPTTSLPVYPGP